MHSKNKKKFYKSIRKREPKIKIGNDLNRKVTKENI